jgi:hypothetical protein
MASEEQVTVWRPALRSGGGGGGGGGGGVKFRVVFWPGG